MKRGVLLLAGSLLGSVCYAWTIRARLGLGPLYAVQDGLARHVGVSIGTSVMGVGAVLVVAALALRARPGIGTLILPFLGGYALDRLLPHTPHLHGLAIQALVVVVASWLMGLSGAVIIQAAVGAAALDAVTIGLHRLVGRPLAATRLCMEASMLVGGWLLGGAIGVGTVITGALIGPALQWWLRILGVPALPVADGETEPLIPLV